MARNLLEIYSLMYQRLCVLNDNSLSTATGIALTENINGVDELTFKLPLTSDKWKYVKNENLVKWKGEFYFIKTPSMSHSQDSKAMEVKCRHFSSSLESIKNIDMDSIGLNVIDLLKEVLGYARTPLGAWDDTQPTMTGWKLGTVDAPLDKFRSLQTQEQGAFSNLVKIAELFDGILKFHSPTDMYTAPVVDLITTKVDRGLEIRLGKNLKNISVEYDSNEIVTRMYVFGGDDIDTGLEISIVGVNPTGKSYIEDYSYYTAQGYELAYIKAHPELFLHEMVWKSTDYIEEQALYDDAVLKMATVSKPKMKVNLNSFDMSMFPQFRTMTPMNGEYVTVIDEELGLEFKSLITNKRTEEDNKLPIELNISNELEYQSVVKSLMDNSSKISRMIGNSTAVPASWIGGVIDLLKTKLNSTVSGVSTDAQGNVLIENGNHTAAMKLGGGIFGIANTRNEDGTYNWQTFGDGNGFTAQYLNAGILQGGKVKWNLDNTTLDGLPPGALRIGDSALSYVLYFDGTTLRLGGNVVIDWDTVISPDATQVGAIPGTMIDANNVFTGNVYATNVKGGQISGCLFKTAPATQTASYIKIYETYIDFVDSTGTSVFKMGTGFPEAQAGKPQLFLGEGCSVDVYQGSLRLRANDGQLNTSNYIRINKAVLDASGNYVSGGGVDYVIGNNVYPIIGGDGSGGTTGTPVFG